jgi:carbon-monoxide dehydrogenase medium subunit
MKFPAFSYIRPDSLSHALATLASGGEAVPVAGGQSLMTMMSFRVARPEQLVDISRLADLQRVDSDTESVRIGAAVTHARIEDGAVPGPLGAFLARAANGIAFRAIRNRGTIGGSLAHADPAADWPVILACLGATIEIVGPDGSRNVAVSELIEDQMQTTLQSGELITSIAVPTFGWRGLGLHKFARKAGEFAEALAVAAAGADGLQIWTGVLSGGPVRLVAEVDPAELRSDRRVADTASYATLLSAIHAAVPDADPYRSHLAAVAACRAVEQAYSPQGAVR